jgi:integron integrase
VSYCEAHEFYDELGSLLVGLSNGVRPTSASAARLVGLLDKWDSIVCPEAGCTPHRCPYAQPADWVASHGYACLSELIAELDQSKELRKLPTKHDISQASFASSRSSCQPLDRVNAPPAELGSGEFTTKPRLLDRVRQCIHIKGYSPATESAYVYWIKRFIFFHHKQHPALMGVDEVQEFLTNLAEQEHVSSSTQNQAMSALLFLYKAVLRTPLEERIQASRAKRYQHIPTVLSVDEVRLLFEQLNGTSRLMAQLTYGSGLRLLEVHRLRVCDIDFAAKRVHVRDSKGRKDRSTLLPSSLIPDLRSHLARVSALHTEDLMLGYGNSVLPRAYHLKSKTASRQFRWQFVFPATRLFHDLETGLSGRWHVNESVLQRAVHRAADQAKIHRRVSVHTLRHSFATHLLQDGYDIRIIQTLLGHTNVNTTMIYAHIADNLGLSTRSPFDRMNGKAGDPINV